MSLELIKEEDVKTKGRKKSESFQNNVVNSAIKSKNVLAFLKDITPSEPRYGLFDLQDFSEILPPIGTDVSVIDLIDAQIWRSQIYSTVDWERLHIHRQMRYFFRKYMRPILNLFGIELNEINDEIFKKYIEGDKLLFYINLEDNTDIMVKYIRVNLEGKKLSEEYLKNNYPYSIRLKPNESPIRRCSIDYTNGDIISFTFNEKTINISDNDDLLRKVLTEIKDTKDLEKIDFDKIDFDKIDFDKIDFGKIDFGKIEEITDKRGRKIFSKNPKDIRNSIFIEEVDLYASSIQNNQFVAEILSAIVDKIGIKKQFKINMVDSISRLNMLRAKESKVKEFKDKGIETITLECEVCGLVYELSNFELEDFNKLMIKYGLKGPKCINYIELIKGETCKKGQHKFKFFSLFENELNKIIELKSGVDINRRDLEKKLSLFDERIKDLTNKEEINNKDIADIDKKIGELIKRKEQFNRNMEEIIKEKGATIKKKEDDLNKLEEVDKVDKVIKDRLYQLTRSTDINQWYYIR